MEWVYSRPLVRFLDIICKQLVLLKPPGFEYQAATKQYRDVIFIDGDASFVLYQQIFKPVRKVSDSHVQALYRITNVLKLTALPG